MKAELQSDPDASGAWTYSQTAARGHCHKNYGDQRRGAPW